MNTGTAGGMRTVAQQKGANAYGVEDGRIERKAGEHAEPRRPGTAR